MVTEVYWGAYGKPGKAGIVGINFGQMQAIITSLNKSHAVIIILQIYMRFALNTVYYVFSIAIVPYCIQLI